MRYSLWMLNGTFALFLFGVIILFLLTKPTLPPRTSLTLPATPSLESTDQGTPKIDLASIYEKDPFGTVSTITEDKIKNAAPRVEPVPLPPSQPQFIPPVHPQPQFLPPLSILLKGVIFSENDHDNRAIIADKKTKTELLYKVGDSILDAQIIRIESNKIIIMRSNGQQETIFTSPLDAHNDPLYQQNEQFKNSTLSQAIRPQGRDVIAIDPELLIQTITNLAQFIELLDITTVYEKGHGIGCRIGQVHPGSLGALLGLESYDIITNVNTIPTDTASNRIAIYEQIRRLKLEDTIPVHIMRANQSKQITYVLNSFAPRKRVVPLSSPQQYMPGTLPPQSSPKPAPIPSRQQYPHHTKPLPSPTMPIPHQGSLQKIDKSGMFENGGRSGMLRSAQP